MFKSTRASIAVGGMAAVKKGIDAKLFEEILDKGAGHNTIEEVSKDTGYALAEPSRSSSHTF